MATPAETSVPVCAPKRRFPSAEVANSRLDEIDRERPRRPGRKLPIRSYRCEFCGGWHLTSQARRSV